VALPQSSPWKIVSGVSMLNMVFCIKNIYKKPGMVAHTWKPLEAEIGRIEVGGQSG
jgi:hypothetical protein